MERLHPILRQLIEYYPFFKEGYSSTNFSYEGWIDKFFGLMDVLGEYPARNFTYHLQLSVDGPPEINDAGRGEGVTERCLKNFNKLIEQLANGRLPKNVFLDISLKGTLDNSSMRLLDTQDKIIAYYKFYEDNFLLPIYDLQDNHVTTRPAIPNTAVPSPVTVDDGKFFAKLAKNCRAVEKRNKDHEILKCYDDIVPFHNDICQTCLTYSYGYHTCGSGTSLIGLLPDNMSSTCHEGFTQIVEEYQKIAAEDTNENSTITFDKFVDQQAISLCVTDEQQKMHMYKMDLYNKDNTTARLAINTAMIIALAIAGQIEQKYTDETNALKAAIFLQGHTAYCIKDNYNKTGSYVLQPVGLYKLLLNGAMDYIQNDDELKVGGCVSC